MKSNLCIVMLCLFFIQKGLAQTEGLQLPSTIDQSISSSTKTQCGTPSPDEDTRRYIFEEIISKEKQRASLRNDVTECLPVKVHIVRNDDGTGGLPLEDLAIAFANLNYAFYDADIEFFVCGDINYIDDTDFYDFDQSAPDSDDENTFVSVEEVADAINVFFTNSIRISSGANAAGYARFPYDAASSNRIFMINSVADNAPNSTFSHELGHYFSLYHTHEGTEDGNMDPNAERVVRSGVNANCETNGDLLCDTDADPKYDSGDFNSGSCSYTGSGMDDLNATYTPTTAIDNIMSYYPDQCGGVFSAGQFTRIASGLATRKTYSSYDFSCSAISVTAASGLTATLNNNEIDLSWTDNASNELGYIIERSSTSSSAGFLPVIYGGVASNTTTFTDSEGLENNTTYYYRIRPVNSACDNYSNVASVAVGLMYCSPSYFNVCSGSVINDFTFDGDGGANEINNTSTSCVTSYIDYSNLSAVVTAGSTYSYEVCKSGNFVRYIEVWVDWNQDGDFEDSDEQMIKSSSSFHPCYSGSMTVPVGATNGTTRLRIIITNGAAPTDPCGKTYSHGESEDYSLTITGGLPIELTKFDGNLRGETVELSWETATETNNDFFTLEKSRDGNYFEKIMNIEGAGNSQISQFYQFTDDHPYKGDNYYRLKQTDFDGKFSYSDIIVVPVVIEGNSAVNVFPNPVESDKANLIYNAPSEGDLEVLIFDMRGKVIRSENLKVFGGKNNFLLDFEKIEVGVYLIQTQQGGFVETIRLVKI